MPNYRIPILVWQDHEGLFTACAVEPLSQLVGTGTNARGAIAQMKQYLEWSYGNEGWSTPPEISDEKLRFHSVSVRPVYSDGDDGRRYPCDEMLTLKVPCVVGQRRDRVFMCSIPTFGISFDYYSADSFEDLVSETIRGVLADKSPSQLLRMLPPKNAELERISIRIRMKPFRDMDFEPDEITQVADSLTDRAAKKRFENAHMRLSEVRELTDLLRREQTSVLLVGERGVGKTTLLAEAARGIELSQKQNKTPKEKQIRFYSTNAGRLIAGMQYLGEWQQRCEDVVDELNQLNGVLCIESLLDLVRTGGLDATDSLAAFFRSFMQHSELRMVAEVTPEELTTCERLIPGLTDAFRKLVVEPLGNDESIQAIEKLSENRVQKLSGRVQLTVDPHFIETTYRLYRRFLPYQTMPGPAASFVRNTIERAVDELAESKTDNRSKPELTINADLARTEFGKQTGLPMLFLRDDLPLEYDEVLGKFNKRVIGQDSACAAAAEVVTRFKAGLNDPNRPISVQLFCGPTGVGKTQLAKEMSEFCFGHGAEKDRLIRIDMSEYSGWGAADRLLDPEGTLMQSVRQQPFVVVLLDEIEKAAVDVFDVLLSLFDEGVVSDKWGRKTWFRSAMIVMTSNLGAGSQRRAGFATEVTPAWEREVERFFRPEFVNRIDEIVAFDSLSHETICLIARRELHTLQKREGLIEFGRKLSFTDALVEHVADCGFDIHPVRSTPTSTLHRTPRRRAALTVPRNHVSWLESLKSTSTRQRTEPNAIQLDFDEASGITIEWTQREGDPGGGYLGLDADFTDG